jgi:hypothetical protein
MICDIVRSRRRIDEEHFQDIVLTGGCKVHEAGLNARLKEKPATGQRGGLLL